MMSAATVVELLARVASVLGADVGRVLEIATAIEPRLRPLAEVSDPASRIYRERREAIERERSDELAALNETLLEHAAASTSEGASDVSGRRALAEARVKRFLDRSEKPSI